MFHANLSTTEPPDSARLPESDKRFSATAPPESRVESLAAVWASRYIKTVVAYEDDTQARSDSFQDLMLPSHRVRTAKGVLKRLNMVSAAAWSATEALLSSEIPRHGINLDLINPWQIAADIHELYKRTFQAYAEGEPPQRLSVVVGRQFGQIRLKYTADDPRVIGFVSMQLHFTGQKLLEQLSGPEQVLVAPYLKVMDDHMYMPLQAAYQAAAEHRLDSSVLLSVQQLLLASTTIAKSVCDQVLRQYPEYRSRSGALNSLEVKTSSLRDVEMFQVYLCLCALENNVSSVQRELFPLCVMLYPQLNVSWRLVTAMLDLLGWEMLRHLKPEAAHTFVPHLRTFSEMFSLEVVQPMGIR